MIIAAIILHPILGLALLALAEWAHDMASVIGHGIDVGLTAFANSVGMCGC